MSLIKWYLTIAAIFTVAILSDPIKPDASAQKGTPAPPASESTNIVNNTVTAR